MTATALQEQVLQAVSKLCRRIEKREYFGKFGATPVQQGPFTSNIAEELRWPAPTVLKRLRRLEAMGKVTSHQHRPIGAVRWWTDSV